MKKLVFILILVVPYRVFACDDCQVFEFGSYGSNSTSDSHGESVLVQSDKITIDKGFISDLIKSPNGKELSKNRAELLYFISCSDKGALLAGAKTLANLIENPEFMDNCHKDCGPQTQLYLKEELAFALSRSLDIYDTFCELSTIDRELVVNYYKDNPLLWGQIYDPPWEGFECK